jgi:biopolymer transport protein ExbB/TolQ
VETIVLWYQRGGPLMAPILGVSALGLVVLIDRFVHIVLRARTNSRPFIERVISLVRADKFDEALALCAEHESALPDLGLVILRSRVDDESDLRHVASTATLTVVPQLTRRLNWIPVIATLAVLVGLLGAIVNLHYALTEPGFADADRWITGIAYALRPLGAGILAAIPLVAGHAYLRSEAEKIVGHLEEFSARLVNALVDRPDVRLGHRS